MSECGFESITESELIRLENEECRTFTKEEQQYRDIETKELLWSLEKKLVEITSTLCKLTDVINNIIYKLNDMDKHIVLPKL